MTVYTFTVVRPNSLDPLEVISDATRQAQAESLVKEGREGLNPANRDSLSCHYEVEGQDVYLVVRGEEAPVRHVAGQMNTRYGHSEPKVESFEELPGDTSA
jgi:hypothetical protein